MSLRLNIVCTALIATAVLGACDTREQKPKVGFFGPAFPIGAAYAQQADLVVPPHRAAAQKLINVAGVSR